MKRLTLAVTCLSLFSHFGLAKPICGELDGDARSTHIFEKVDSGYKTYVVTNDQDALVAGLEHDKCYCFEGEVTEPEDVLMPSLLEITEVTVGPTENCFSDTQAP